MKVIELVHEMQELCSQLRQQSGTRVCLVATMGALHSGHASLVEMARRGRPETLKVNNSNNNNHNNRQQQDHDMKNSIKTNGNLNCLTIQTNDQNRLVVVVSIFVNKKQFNNKSDFHNYPSTLASDLELCRNLGVDYVFAPSHEQMYPDDDHENDDDAQADHFRSCMVEPPSYLAALLEGRSRPGHFRGMLTVVCKLFQICRPHVAYFGEKDYQQAVLVSQMVRDLNFDVNIELGKTARDVDLLPLSSRNVRLSHWQRSELAPIMCKILFDSRDAIEFALKKNNNFNDTQSLDACDLNSILYATMLTTMALNLSTIDNNDSNYLDEQFHVDYLEIRCARDLTQVRFRKDLGWFDCDRHCLVRHGFYGRLQTRILISVVVGDIRLLDNVGLELTRS